MKLLILPVLLSLGACSTCDIPLVAYGSHGGSEHQIKLDLSSEEFTLFFEQWQPGNYENRSKREEQGQWSCTGNTADFTTKNGRSKADYKEIGENPMGLPKTLKALVFMPSKNEVLSNELLYPLKALENIK